MGEITADCYADIPAIARRTVKEIGYDKSDYGFDCNTCAVLTAINEQSGDIARGVGASAEARGSSVDMFDKIGAGDQGMVFGYACDQTPELMPTPIYYAHKLTRRLAEVRKSGILPFIRPDGKSQVTLEYSENGSVLWAPAVVISTQHDENVKYGTLFDAVMEEVIKKTLPAEILRKDTKYYINPTGRFVIGGPQGDSGLTGRKLIADTYGGYARHGGGSFSGKDPTKVDRSAAYMARYVAKNIVAAELAREIELTIAYAIGVAHPVMVAANTFGTGVLPDEKLTKLINECFDMRPAAIIHNFDMLRPIYQQVSAYGHFGRGELDLPWERTDKVQKLLELAK